MATLKVRHLVQKQGRFYWQPSALLRSAGWRPMRLPDTQAEAIAKAEALNAEVDTWRAGAPTPNAPAAAGRKRKAAPGSVSALIADYKASRFWPTNAKTRAGYQWCLDMIEAWAGDMPARAITPPAVQAFYLSQLRRSEGTGKARRVIETPAKAAAAVRVLRVLLQVGVRLGYVTSNAAARPGIGLERQREPVLWSPAEVAHMAATADAMGWRSIGTAILLNDWLGQRVSDVLALPPHQVEAGALVIRQGKRQRRVALPLHLVPHLVERLQAERTRDGAVVSATHLLVHDRTGQPWKLFTFDHVFAAIRAKAAAGDEEAGLPAMPSCSGLRFAELRHSAVTRLNAAGVDPIDIAGITGHAEKSVRQLLDRHYLIRTAKGAERAFMARLKAEGEG
jgi:integrase